MKYLCLAYGSETDWNRLSSADQAALLAQDDVVRSRGNLVAAVRPTVVTVRAWDGIPETTAETFAHSQAPLAGFSIIEADSVEDVVRLVAGTPCARAHGAIEIRPVLALSEYHTPEEHRPT